VEKTGTSSEHHRPGYVGETPTRQISHVLMSAPEYFAVTEARNPFSRENSQVDLPLALTQWNTLCDAFLRVGVEVSLLEPHPGLEAMCFSADQAFVGIDHEAGPFAIPSRMLHRSRRDEIEISARWYSHQGFRIIDLGLEGEEFLEGAGDLLWNPGWESVWAGFGPRSTRGAVDQFANVMESMGFVVRKLEIADPHFHHLNLCLAPLTPESLLVYPGAFDPDTLAHIRSCSSTFEVTREEALQFMCNGVSVNGYYVTSKLSRRLEQILGREGIEPIIVELSEFQKAGGSVASLKMLLP